MLFLFILHLLYLFIIIQQTQDYQLFFFCKRTKGRALDNIFIERYWKSYKYESVFLHNYFNVFDAELKTFQHVEFYNSRGFHSSLL